MAEGFIYKSGNDAIQILGSAIYKYFKGREDKINGFYTKQMAEIITDGFLDDILSEQENLIAHNEGIVKNLKNTIERNNATLYRIEREIKQKQTVLDGLKAALKEIEEAIKAHDKAKIGEVETDSALVGAKRAYDWIFEKTGDADKAAKAFDSYLIGGKYTDGETYDGDVKEIDADSIINAVKRKALNRIMRL